MFSPVGALTGGEPLHHRAEQGIPGAEVVGGVLWRQSRGHVDGAMGQRVDARFAEYADRSIEQVVTPLAMPPKLPR